MTFLRKVTLILTSCALIAGTSCGNNRGTAKPIATVSLSPSGVAASPSPRTATSGNPSKAGAPAASRKGPPDLKMPFTPDASITGTVRVTPPCVQAGKTVSIQVTTTPRAGIVYQAVYSDNQSGAKPPYGQGYGGNDKGTTDDHGSYNSSWVLSPTTPPGGARIDVFVVAGESMGYLKTAFTVVRALDTC